MRALIYKLVPGLYQREGERQMEFKKQHKELDAEEDLLLKSQRQQQQEFYSPGEPIR